MRLPALQPVLLACLSCGLCALALGLALSNGARAIPLATVWQALVAFDPADPLHGIVRGLRLERAVGGAICGAALATAGVLMQSLTRNPLADPGLMGVNAGAALAVVAALWSLGPQPVPALALAAVAGAGLAALAVWRLSGGSETSASRSLSVRLPLAGMAISSLCLALVAAVVLLSTETRDIYRFWMVGSLGRATFHTLAGVLPLLGLGAGLALLSARGLDAMALGQDVAAGLGTRPALTAALALLGVTLLSGGAVALAGPLGFVGLIVPHFARALVGSGSGAAICVAMPLGATLVLLCDTLGRLAARPSEIAVGLVLALVGGPAFMLLLSRVLRPAP